MAATAATTVTSATSATSATNLLDSSRLRSSNVTMPNRKKETTTQLGKQPPRYRFFLNPYQDVRFRPAWKRGTQQQLFLQEMLEELHDFKEVVTFKLAGGWSR